MAILRDINSNEKNLIDFTRYDLKAKEPESGSTRNWTLYGGINQKQTRKQDLPVRLSKLSEDQKDMIRLCNPNLLNDDKY